MGLHADAYLQVGNEFSQVEGLWSQFENVMAAKEGEKDDTATASTRDGAAGGS